MEQPSIYQIVSDETRPLEELEALKKNCENTNELLHLREAGAHEVIRKCQSSRVENTCMLVAIETKIARRKAQKETEEAKVKQYCEAVCDRVLSTLDEPRDEGK